MTTMAMQWTWHDQCGEGITESAVWAGLGICLLLILIVWAIGSWIEKR